MMTNDKDVLTLDNVIADRMLKIVKPGATRAGFFHHMDVCTNSPRLTNSRAKAMRLTAATAEVIRFNLGARGFRVSMVFEN